MAKAILITVLLFVLSLGAQAQICPGSHLNYYVRDTHGRLIDADGNGLIYEGTGTGQNLFGQWRTQGPGTFHGGFDIPSDLATFDKTRNKSLVIGGMCGFRGPVDLKLTLNGKVMELRFALPDMGSGPASSDFSVDSMPFTPGKFQIDMTKPTTAARYGRYGGYFAASAWKKVI